MSGLTLTNYWLLIGWIALAATVFSFIHIRRPEMVLGRQEVRYPVAIALITALPYIIWAGFRQNGFGDTSVYRNTFLEAGSGWNTALDIIKGDGKDKGFYVAEVLLKSVIGNRDVVFFLIIAAIQLVCVVLIYRKYSEDFFLSVFLFVASTDYLSWTFNGVRQFIAVAMIFASLGLIIKHKWVPVIIIILLASTIHGSAIIMLPVVFVCLGKAWNRWTVLMIILIILTILFLDKATPILEKVISVTQYEGITEEAIWLTDDGTNPIRVLIYSVPAIMALAGRRYLQAEEDPTIDFCVNMSVIATGFYLLSMVTSGIYIGRLPIYMSLYSYISLPWMINHMFEEHAARFIKIVAIVLYLVFFYFQMHFKWALL